MVKDDAQVRLGLRELLHIAELVEVQPGLEDQAALGHFGRASLEDRVQQRELRGAAQRVVGVRVAVPRHVVPDALERGAARLHVGIEHLARLRP